MLHHPGTLNTVAGKGAGEGGLRIYLFINHATFSFLNHARAPVARPLPAHPVRPWILDLVGF